MPWEKVTVKGVRGWKGAIDGESIDSAKIFVEESFDGRGNTEDQFAAGSATVAYDVGGVAVARPLVELPFPVTLEVNFQRVTNGKGSSKTIVSDVRVPHKQAA